MGQIKEHIPVKYFSALCFVAELHIDSILARLETLFGKIDHRSPVYNFDSFTDYYTPEMGRNLKKMFVSFEPLYPPERLVEFKRQTNRMETEYAGKSGQRRINVDPGYLTDAKIVLATTKDYSHRLYLGQGIYGDVHLHYKNKQYQAQPWTYPDYSQPLALDFFYSIRILFREQNKKHFHK